VGGVNCEVFFECSPKDYLGNTLHVKRLLMKNYRLTPGVKVVAVKAAVVGVNKSLEVGKIYTVLRVDAYDPEDLCVQLEGFPSDYGWVTKEDIAPVVNLEEVLYG
jgi:hypothetical protein